MDEFFDQLLCDYLLSFVGTPYIYGGSSFYGIDCSGLVIEALKSCGMLPHHYDGTAKHLYDYFNQLSNTSCEAPKFGALAFFGHKEIGHVGFCLDRYRMIEAGGGDKTTTTLEEAKKRGAFVRIRPIRNRSDLIGYVMPPYPQLSPSA